MVGIRSWEQVGQRVVGAVCRCCDAEEGDDEGDGEEDDEEDDAMGSVPICTKMVSADTAKVQRRLKDMGG